MGGEGGESEELSWAVFEEEEKGAPFPFHDFFLFILCYSGPKVTYYHDFCHVFVVFEM